MLSHPGGHGGLDARPGASLDPRTGANSGNHHEWPHGRACAPIRCPPNRAGVQHFHRLDSGGMLMCARKTVTCLWRFLAHANSALTCEADVAVSPLEPKGDVGDAGEISEG